MLTASAAPITILHGEHTVASRNSLSKYLESTRERNSAVVRLPAKNLQAAELAEILGSTDLFGSEKLLLIEELHSLPKSRKKNELIRMIAESTTPVILWEKRDLTPTMLKQFPGARVEHFKASSTLFTWLQMFGTTQPIPKKLAQLHSAIAADSDQFCFIMLCRHVRNLMQVAAAGTIKGHPFAVAQLKKQAGAFTVEQLRKLHTRLVQIDWTHKTGKATLTLTQELDLLTITE